MIWMSHLAGARRRTWPATAGNPWRIILEGAGGTELEFAPAVMKSTRCFLFSSLLGSALTLGAAEAAPSTSPPPLPPPPPADAIPLEVLGGVAGELAVGAAGFWIAGSLGNLGVNVDTSICQGDPDPGQCREDLWNEAWWSHVVIPGLVGLGVGVGLGSGLGVSIAGGLMHVQGNVGAAILLGLVGVAPALFFPPLGLVTPLLGAMLGYSASPAPAPPRPELRLVPVVRITPAGGMAGVAGTF